MSARRQGVAVGRACAAVVVTAALASCAQVLGFERSEPAASTPQDAGALADGALADAGSAPDAEADADAAPDPFACATAALATVDSSRTVQYRTPLLDVETSGPVTDARIRTCPRTDLSCASPKEGPDGGVRPNEEGVLEGRVEYGFTGYFELQGPRYLPTLLFVNPPPVRDLVAQQVPVVTPTLFATLAFAATHVSDAVDPTLGHVFVHVEDCTGAGRAGVRVRPLAEVPGKTLSFYLTDLLPAPNVTETDKSGYAGVLNLTPGLVTVAASFADGRTFGSVTFGVRAGALSYVSLIPKW